MNISGIFNLNDILTGITGQSLPNYTILIINVCVFFLISKFMYWILKKVVLFFTRHTKTDFDDELVKSIEYPLLLSILILFLNSQIIYISASTIIGFWADKITGTIVIIMVTWFLYKLIGLIDSHILRPLASKTESDIDDQLFPLIRKILRVILILFALIYILGWFGIDIGPLIAGIGIGGIALAFAAQKVLGDVFGGIAIFVDKPFKINDRIKIENIVGTVIDVGLRSTKIRTMDNNVLIIPNSKVADNLIENYNAPDHRLVIRTTIGLVYDTPVKDIEKAKNLLREILDANNAILKDFFVGLIEFADSSVNILIVYTVKDYSKSDAVRDAINMEIKRIFDKEKLEFAFPTQTLYLKK